MRHISHYRSQRQQTTENAIADEKPFEVSRAFVVLVKKLWIVIHLHALYCKDLLLFPFLIAELLDTDYLFIKDNFYSKTSFPQYCQYIGK